MNYFLCQLKVFVIVVWVRSFSWVGEMIGLSQLVVSYSVKELEYQIGVCLFDCIICEVVFIEVGQQLVGRLECLFDELMIILCDVGWVGQQLSGIVKVVVSQMIFVYFILQCIVYSNCCYFDIDFVLYDWFQQWVLESICQGEVDFGIVIDLGLVVDFQCEVVLVELFLLFCWEDYFFVSLIEVLWQVLQDERLILQDYVFGSCLLIDVVFSRLVIWVNIVQEIGYLVMLFLMVELGIGISVLLVLVLLLLQGSYLMVKWLILVMEWQLMLVCRKNCLLLIVVQVLWEIVCEEGENLIVVRVEDLLYQC